MSSPCSNAATMKRTTAERRIEVQIGSRVIAKCPQAESQTKISETKRDLKRFQFLLFLRARVRAIHLRSVLEGKGTGGFYSRKGRNVNADRRESNPSAEISTNEFCLRLAASPNTGQNISVVQWSLITPSQLVRVLPWDSSPAEWNKLKGESSTSP